MTETWYSAGSPGGLDKNKKRHTHKSRHFGARPYSDAKTDIQLRIQEFLFLRYIVQHAVCVREGDCLCIVLGIRECAIYGWP